MQTDLSQYTTLYSFIINQHCNLCIRGSVRAAGNAAGYKTVMLPLCKRRQHSERNYTHNTIILKCDTDYKKKTIEELFYEKDKK